MFIHNLDPVLFDFGFLEIRWYSLAYIFGILFGWWFGKHLIKIKFYNYQNEKLLKDFDDLVTFLIISIILGGRLGYIIFYNLEYYTNNPFEIVKVWKGGMSFHGALIGIVIGTYLFSIKKGIKLFLLFAIEKFKVVNKPSVDIRISKNEKLRYMFFSRSIALTNEE